MNGDDHMHGPPPPAQARHMMMHMTFFWGTNTEVLFDGWPGYDRPGMYILALVVVFAGAAASEWLSYGGVLRESGAAGWMRTALYAVRVGVSYLVMLAVMSFNAGVFLAAIAGHGFGFFFFGRKVVEKRVAEADPPPLNCGC